MTPLSNPWRIRRPSPSLAFGLAVLAVLVGLALCANLLPHDPFVMMPAQRMRPPSLEHFLGTDNLGRDVFARVTYGARISLFVGFAAMAVALGLGALIGLPVGYYPALDGPVMRVMDALMSIPTILLAISLFALSRGGLAIVVIGIAIPEVPRVVRLVRSTVMTVRSAPYIEAAICAGQSDARILIHHILPSTLTPLTVQGAYVVASAILLEAGLSFLGIGISTEIPTWGNMIASSRSYLSAAPWSVFAPGLALALCVLAINILGDHLRDHLDPRTRGRR